ncbi:hypothetical protein, partial [Paralcaligenes ginsengisoli]
TTQHRPPCGVFIESTAAYTANTATHRPKPSPQPIQAAQSHYPSLNATKTKATKMNWHPNQQKHVRRETYETKQASFRHEPAY